MSIYIDDSENDSDEDEYSGIDATEESESETSKSEIKYPFDPRQIKITPETSTIYNLVMRMKSNGIDLYPDFQRKGNLWKIDRQSRLIESLLLRFPLPAFYFDVEERDLKGNEKWLVVDGLQRLSTIKNFIIENTIKVEGVEKIFKLEGLEILKDYEGYTFKNLEATLRRRILETNVTTFLIQPGTPKEVKYNVFKRINTGGVGLTPMEIRHALNQKKHAGKFLKTLTEDPKSFFKQFLQENKIKATRLEDRELLLRYVAFSLTSYKDYEPSLSNFLDTAMEKLDLLEKEACKDWENKLQYAMNTYYQLFDSKRFGRILSNRCKLNSALFEAWTSILGKLNENQQQQLLQKKDDIKKEYNLLLSDKAFQTSFTLRTSNKTAVETRFTKINTLIQSFLND